MIFRMSTRGGSPVGILFAFLFLGMMLLGLFLFFGLMLRLLYVVGPVLLILAVILDYKTVISYIGGIGTLLRQQPLRGIFALVLSLLGYPIVALFLLGRILLYRRLGKYEQQMRQQAEGQMTDYEELESRQLPPNSRMPDYRGDSDLV